MFRNLGLFTLTVCVLICCTEKKHEQSTAASPPGASDSLAIINNKNLNVRLLAAEEIDSSGILMFPLQAENKERGSGSFGSYDYKEIPYNSFWNIVFYNSLSGEYHLLSEQKMLILKYAAGGSSDGEHRLKGTRFDKSIFYEMITTDHNGDKLFDSNDPQYLFMSDNQGYHLKQLSPVGLTLSSWSYIKGSSRIVMRLIKDSDNNKKFEDSDELLAYEYDLVKDSAAREIFPAAFKNRLKILFDKDWKAKKK